MKLVKLLSKPTGYAGIVGIPDAENITTKETLLISEARWTLLLHSGIRFLYMKDFNETACADIGDFDTNKTYVIKELVKPSEVSSFDPSKYEVGDYIFFYTEGPVKPTNVPIMDKPLPGFEFTSEEKMAALNKYNTEMAEYEEVLKQYILDVDTFLKEEALLPEYGYLVEIVDEEHYRVISDFSYETTKTIDQFKLDGKLPKGVATKVTNALGEFNEDDSLKGLTLKDIFTKLLDLENEEDVINEIFPNS